MAKRSLHLVAPKMPNFGSYWWVESYGSLWHFDDDLMHYRRWPKHEGPRDDRRGA